MRMPNKVNIADLYFAHRIPNPINITLTFKLQVDGQRLDQITAVQNVKHFRNRLNRHLYGNAHRRFRKELKLFVVHEGLDWTRHHIHAIIERPAGLSVDEFITLVTTTWAQTRFGYSEHHYEVPISTDREVDWVYYILKKRTKADLASSVDWENSSCFGR